MPVQSLRVSVARLEELSVERSVAPWAVVSAVVLAVVLVAASAEAQEVVPGAVAVEGVRP